MDRVARRRPGRRRHRPSRSPEILEAEHGFVAVDLPPRITRAFYEGYSNNTLWPLLHGLPSRASFDPETWHAYRDANERFTAAILERLRPDDLVWVHDYQLMLVPGMLREAAPGVRVGFFLHIPFPASDVFRILPQRDAILEGLLGADVVAFQTHEHLGAFRGRSSRRSASRAGWTASR